MKLKNVEKQLCKLFKNQWGALPEIAYDDDVGGLTATIELNYALADISKNFYFQINVENFPQVVISLGRIVWSEEVARAVNNFNEMGNPFKAYFVDGQLVLGYSDRYLRDEKSLARFFDRAVSAFEIYIDRLAGIWEQIQEIDGE